MDYSQSVFRLHHFEDLGLAISSNASLPSPIRINPTSQTSCTTAQIALQLIPSAVLLLLFPIRSFQLRRASLKVLPNYTGAIKAVGCSRGRMTEKLADSLAGAHCSHRSSQTCCSGPMLDIYSASGWAFNCKQCHLLRGCSRSLPIVLL